MLYFLQKMIPGKEEHMGVLKHLCFILTETTLENLNFPKIRPIDIGLEELIGVIVKTHSSA